MTARPAGAPARLSDEDLVRMMGLMKGSDSVELKLTVPVASHRATIADLPLDPVEAQPRQIYFLDTPELSPGQGRRRGASATIRRWPRRCGHQAPTGRPERAAERHPPIGLVQRRAGCAARWVRLLRLDEGANDRPGRALGCQRGDPAAQAVHRGAAPVLQGARRPMGSTLDDLTVLGPTFVLKGVFEPPELKRRFVAEMWLYPDGSRILELSTKCLPSETFQVAAESRSYLAGKGVNLTGAQQTKTRTALRYFQGASSSGPPRPAARRRRTGRGGRARRRVGQRPRGACRGERRRQDHREGAGEARRRRRRRRGRRGRRPPSPCRMALDRGQPRAATSWTIRGSARRGAGGCPPRT